MNKFDYEIKTGWSIFDKKYVCYYRKGEPIIPTEEEKLMLNDMTLNEYQQKALETANYPEQYKILYPALGLTGEAGEVSDKVKKVIRDENGIFTDEKKLEIAKELGDVLWYVATFSRDIGYTLEDIAKMNYEKLKSRQERNVISGSGDNR